MDKTRRLVIILFSTQLAIDGDYWMTEPRTAEPVPPRGFYLSELPLRTRDAQCPRPPRSALSRACPAPPSCRRKVTSSVRHLAAAPVFRLSSGKKTRLFILVATPTAWWEFKDFNSDLRKRREHVDCIAPMTTMSRSFLVDSLITPRPSEANGRAPRGYSPPTSTPMPSLLPLHPCPPGKHSDVLSLYSCRSCVPIPPALKQAMAPTLTSSFTPTIGSTFSHTPTSLAHTPVLRPVPVSLPVPPIYPLYTPSTPTRAHLTSPPTPLPEKKSPVQGKVICMRMCVFALYG